MHAACGYGGLGRVSYPLELELQMLMSYCVGAGSQTWVICQSSKCSQVLSQLSCPLLLVIKQENLC